jgi:hypothetical protein
MFDISNIHIPFLINSIATEVGNIANSKEVNSVTPQVPLTVHNCIAPNPSIEPSIERKLVEPSLVLSFILFLISCTKQLLDIEKKII